MKENDKQLSKAAQELADVKSKNAENEEAIAQLKTTVKVCL